MSGLRVADSISALDGTSPVNLTAQEGIKTRANYDLAGTATLLGDLNVASLTDLGVGSAQINYTNTFAAASGMARGVSVTGGNFASTGTVEVSNAGLATRVASTGAAGDVSQYMQVITGDLA